MKKKKKWLWSIIIFVIIAIGVWWQLAGNKQESTYSTVVVESGPLVQTVSETGTLKPVKEVALNFLSTGRIKSINVQVGDKVEAGEVLAALDDSALLLRKLEAEAGLEIAKASLSKTLAGASGESIAISRSGINQAQVSADSAKVDLANTKKSVAESLRQAEKTLADLESDSPLDITAQEQAIATAQTALENTQKTGQQNVDNARNSALLALNDKILSARIAQDNINTILEDSDAKPVLSAKNSALLAKTKNSRLKAISLVLSAEKNVASAKLDGSESAMTLAGSSVQSLLLETKQMLDYTYAMLEATVTSADFSQADLDSYKSLVSTQSSQINSASTIIENSLQAFFNSLLSQKTALATAEESLNQTKVALANAILSTRNTLDSLKLSGDQQIASAQARLDSANQSLVLAQAQFNNTVAPARTQDLSLSQAQLSQSQATLAGIEQQINDTLLLAPLDGVVTALNYEVGEQVGTGVKPVITILVNNSFNIEVDISESNISKVKLNDLVDITFDAFSDDFVLKGKISFIEPAQTLIQDVVYYKVKIDFLDLNTSLSQIAGRGLSLKSGMTANIVITTDEREDVVQVPARALIERGEEKIIRLLVNDVLQEVPVVTGLRGNEGMTEVISGVKEGDNVITFIKTDSSAK